MTSIRYITYYIYSMINPIYVLLYTAKLDNVKVENLRLKSFAMHFY